MVFFIKPSLSFLSLLTGSHHHQSSLRSLLFVPHHPTTTLITTTKIEGGLSSRYNHHATLKESIAGPLFATVAQVEAFYDRECAQDMDEYMQEEIEFVREDLELLLKNLDKDKSGIILDMGCGTGEMLLWISNHLDKAVADSFQLQGIDLSNDMLDVARQKLKDRAITLEQGNVEHLGTMEDSSCAIVVCTFVIHHLQDARNVLNEISRVLKPEGLLYLSFWDGRGIMPGDAISNYFHEASTLVDQLKELHIKIDFSRENKLNLNSEEGWEYSHDMQETFFFGRKLSLSP